MKNDIEIINIIITDFYKQWVWGFKWVSTQCGSFSYLRRCYLIPLGIEISESKCEVRFGRSPGWDHHGEPSQAVCIRTHMPRHPYAPKHLPRTPFTCRQLAEHNNWVVTHDPLIIDNLTWICFSIGMVRLLTKSRSWWPDLWTFPRCYERNKARGKGDIRQDQAEIKVVCGLKVS